MRKSTISMVKWTIGAAALLVGLTACSVPAPGEDQATVGTVQSGLCMYDTHCEYYTDATYSNLCGERDICISCTSQSYSWGCRTTFSWCEQIAQCVAPKMPTTPTSRE